MDHPRRWWIVRIEFAIGAAAVGLGLLVYVSMPIMMTEPSPGMNPLVLAGLVGLAIGLIWMIRVFRGPKGRPSTRRYRDR